MGIVVVAAATAVLALVWSQANETHRTDAYLAADAKEHGELLDRAVELEGSSLATFANDYSLWGEMVRFVQTGDRTWAHVNIDVGMGTYKADAAWVFDSTGSRVYEARDSILETTPEPLPPGFRVKDEFSGGHSCHFFVAGPDGPVEIRGSTIQPSEDDERKTPARGYFLVARSWNRQHLAELSRLTGKTIRIEPAGPGATSSGEIARQSGTITFTRPLPSIQGGPELMLTASLRPGWTGVARRSGRSQFVQFALLALLGVVGLTLALEWWVTQPLGLLKRSLESGTTDALELLERSRTEFGQLAQLVRRFHGQNAELVEEVTYRKQTEAALRQSEEKFRQTFDYAVVGKTLTAPDGQLLMVNAAFSSTLGYSVEELRALNLADVTHPDDVKRSREVVRSLLAGERRVARFELRYVHRNGAVVWTEVGTFLLRDPQGQPLYLISHVLNITERKTSEWQLAEHSAELQLLNDIDSSINRGEPLAETIRLLRQGTKRLLQGRVADLYLVDESGQLALQEPEMPEENLRAVEKLIDSAIPPIIVPDRAGSLLFEILRSGHSRLLDDAASIERFMRECAPSPLYDHLLPVTRKAPEINGVILAPLVTTGRLLGMIVVSSEEPFTAEHVARLNRIATEVSIAIARQQDVAELERHRSHLEQLVAERTRELTAAQEQLVLQEKLATLGRVAGSVAHELRNPLGAIRNASYFLQTTAASRLEGKPLHHLQIIDEYVERANKAISMILDFTQGRTVEPDLCTLRSILERAVAEMDVPRAVEVLIAVPPSLPQVLVDDSQVIVVFRNLVTNAVQAMPKGGTVRIQARAVKNEVVVDVVDTGEGIKPEHMKSLFKPLFTTKSIGVGLGLAICRVFIEANKGTISVASEVGKGTAFTVTLPTAEGQTLNRRPPNPRP
jgi:two-component system sensor kinase FixL